MMILKENSLSSVVPVPQNPLSTTSSPLSSNASTVHISDAFASPISLTPYSPFIFSAFSPLSFTPSISDSEPSTAVSLNGSKGSGNFSPLNGSVSACSPMKRPIRRITNEPSSRFSSKETFLCGVSTEAQIPAVLSANKKMKNVIFQRDFPQVAAKVPFEVIKLKGLFPSDEDETSTYQTDFGACSYLKNDIFGAETDLFEMPVVKKQSYYEKVLSTCIPLEEFIARQITPPDDTDEEHIPYSDQPASLLPLCAQSFPDSQSVSRIFLEENRAAKQPCWNHFRPGATFSGYQRSGQNNYLVIVTFQHIDLDRSHLCGYLKIKGLTKEYPELTTFFEAEIIGPHYHFITYKWDATPSVDYEHWTKFPGFFKSEQVLKEYDKSPINLNVSPYLFMRWKEHFLVPDHRIRQISGASYEGFYYICMNLKEGEISGYYYHSQSEQFQELCLKYVSEKSFGIYEFH